MENTNEPNIITEILDLEKTRILLCNYMDIFRLREEVKTSGLNNDKNIEKMNDLPVSIQDIGEMETSFSNDDLKEFIEKHNLTNTAEKTKSEQEETNEMNDRLSTIKSIENDINKQVCDHFEELQKQENSPLPQIDLENNIITINFVKEIFALQNQRNPDEIMYSEFWNQLLELFIEFSNDNSMDLKREKIRQIKLVNSPNYKYYVYNALISLRFIYLNNRKVLLKIKKEILMKIIKEIYACQEVFGLSDKQFDELKQKSQTVIKGITFLFNKKEKKLEIPQGTLNDIKLDEKETTNITEKNDNIETKGGGITEFLHRNIFINKKIPEIEQNIIAFFKLYNNNILSVEELAYGDVNPLLPDDDQGKWKVDLLFKITYVVLGLGAFATILALTSGTAALTFTSIASYLAVYLLTPQGTKPITTVESSVQGALFPPLIKTITTLSNRRNRFNILRQEYKTFFENEKKVNPEFIISYNSCILSRTTEYYSRILSEIQLNMDNYDILTKRNFIYLDLYQELFRFLYQQKYFEYEKFCSNKFVKYNKYMQNLKEYAEVFKNIWSQDNSRNKETAKDEIHNSREMVMTKIILGIKSIETCNVKLTRKDNTEEVIRLLENMNVENEIDNGNQIIRILCSGRQVPEYSKIDDRLQEIGEKIREIEEKELEEREEQERKEDEEKEKQAIIQQEKEVSDESKRLGYKTDIGRRRVEEAMANEQIRQQERALKESGINVGGKKTKKHRLKTSVELHKTKTLKRRMY